jgi:hypothetical protein
MVNTRWDTETGEVVVRMDATTAQALVRDLAGRWASKTTISFVAALGHTLLHPEPKGGG